MRGYVIILVATIFLVSCKKKEAEPSAEVIKSRKEDVEAIRMILEGALAKQQDNQPSHVSGRAHEEAQVIFKDFWNPKNLKRYGKHEWDTELYTDAEYVILQRSLVVATRKTAEWPVDELKYMSNQAKLKDDEWDVKTIEDFLPLVSIPDTKVVSLTKELSDELNAFLGGDFTEATTPDVMSPAQAWEESRIKLVAAETMVKFYSKHWGDGWHLVSHPQVERIFFDHDYQHALVVFRIVYQGGHAFYQKTPDGWKLAESKITWIE